MRKISTIYELFEEFSEDEINEIIFKLSDEEKELFRGIFGNDLYKPVSFSNWNFLKKKKFDSVLLPKMREAALEIKKEHEETLAEDAILEIMEEHDEIIDSKDKFLEMKLVELMKQDKTNREICDCLDIDNANLYEMLVKLKNKGRLYRKKYYSDGSIVYKSVRSFNNLNNLNLSSRYKSIISDSNENMMKFLLISDLHFGNSLERLDLVDRAFDYCDKNDINIILCGGDLIDGPFSKSKQNISNVFEQAEYFIKNYPYDENILTFSVGGDHDQSAFTRYGLNLSELFNNYRHDVIIGTYNNFVINLKRDQILLNHSVGNNDIIETDAPIILRGHHHKYTSTNTNGILDVTLPTLSNLTPSIPSALELDISFENGFFSFAVLKQIYFRKKTSTIINEVEYDLKKNRDFPDNMINYVENYKNKESVNIKKL